MHAVHAGVYLFPDELVLRVASFLRRGAVIGLGPSLYPLIRGGDAGLNSAIFTGQDIKDAD